VAVPLGAPGRPEADVGWDCVGVDVDGGCTLVDELDEDDPWPGGGPGGGGPPPGMPGCVRVEVGVGAGELIVGVPVSVLVGVPVGVPVSVLVGVPVGVPVSVLVGVPVGVPVSVLVGVPVGVSVSVLVGVPVGSRVWLRCEPGSGL
jgi:hypothetical protein